MSGSLNYKVIYDPLAGAYGETYCFTEALRFLMGRPRGEHGLIWNVMFMREMGEDSPVVLMTAQGPVLCEPEKSRGGLVHCSGQTGAFDVDPMMADGEWTITMGREVIGGLTEDF